MQPRGHHETRGSIIANAHGDDGGERSSAHVSVDHSSAAPPPAPSHDAGVMYRGVFDHPEGRKEQKPAVFLRSEKKQIGKPLRQQSSTPAAACAAASVERREGAARRRGRTGTSGRSRQRR